jgi:carboxylate-amine ligase
VCLRPQDAACLAVLIRALVEASAASWRDGVPAADTPTSLLRLASWRASRWGLSQELMSPALSRPVPAAAAVDELLAFAGPHVTNAAEGRIVRHGIREILRRGNGADRQRIAGASGGGPGAVVRDALALTHDAG